jgi:Ca2+/Na+ antiporter
MQSPFQEGFSILSKSDIILGDLLSTGPFSGYYLIIWFFLFACIVLLSAKFMSNYISKISDATKISSGVIGGIFLSLVTSFPELIAAIYSGTNKIPQFNYYNVSGANMITSFVVSLFFLGMIIWIYVKRLIGLKQTPAQSNKIYWKANPENKLLFLLCVPITFVFMVFILIEPVSKYLFIPGANISLATLVPIAAYAIYVTYVIREQRSINKDTHNIVAISKRVSHRTMIIYVTLLITFSSILIIASYFNSAIVDEFPDRYNIPQNTSAGIILSLATALPEISSFFFLMLKNKPQIAISGIVGSHLFNFVLVFICQLAAVTHGINIFEFMQSTPIIANLRNWSIMTFIISLLFYVQSTNFALRKPIIRITSYSLVILTYMVGYIFSITIFK